MTLRDRLLEGLVIPAHPLALNERRRLDSRRQRALTRYYLAAGAGGLAVGVHTTQFEIHDPATGLLRPVLELAAEEAGAGEARPVLVAGVVGPTAQAVSEADLARELGYDCVLLSMGALRDADDDTLIEHARAVAEVLPLFGFYLQPSVGGRMLSYAFWRRLAEVDNLVAIKIAPFNRYQTLEVVRAVAASGREIALYTGNDDNIVVDLLTRFPFGGLRISGGLLGHWAVWTRRAVELFDVVKAEHEQIPPGLLTRAAEVTDSNAAIFDPENAFAGCIPGIHEVLRRQGLLEGTWTLNSNEQLSPGQADAIDRVYQDYPHLTDDEFVRERLDSWLK